MSTIHDPSATAQASTNGGSQLDPDFITALRQQVEARRVRADELQAELTATNQELKRYERALALLTDEPLGEHVPARSRRRSPGRAERRSARISSRRFARRSSYTRRTTRSSGRSTSGR